MIIDKKSDLQKAYDWINKNETISFDIETNSLSKRTGIIIGFSLCNDIDGIYICTYKYNVGTGKLEATDITKEDVQQVLTALKNKKLWTYNAAFDILFTKNFYDIDLTEALDLDVLLLVHSCNENLYSYKLKDVAAMLFGDWVKKEQDDLKTSIKANGGTKNEFFKADWQILGTYGVQDGILNTKVGKHYLPQLKVDGMWDFFFKDEVMPLYKTVTLPMEEAGIRLDIPMLLETQKEIQCDIQALAAKILSQIRPQLGLWKQWLLDKDYPASRSGAFLQAFLELQQVNLPTTTSGAYSLAEKALESLEDCHAKRIIQKEAFYTPEEIALVQQKLYETDGSPDFNLQSGYHLKKLFFDTLKEIPLSRTDKGAPQCDDDFLDEMASKYEWAEDLRTYRRLNKLEGTYITRFLERAEGDRFYPSWKQHGTVTHRFSGDLQQLPRPLEEGQTDKEIILKYTNKIRNFFIADEDCVLIDADYESLEPHFFAHYSEEPALLNIFKKGHDFYSTIVISAEKVSGVSADKKAENYLGKVAKSKRQAGKAYALGIAYGEEDWKLHHELGIPQSEAKKIISGYWAGFPVLKRKSDANKRLICTNGYIKTEFGLMRRLPEAKEIFERYGDVSDSLELWKKYHDNPGIYEGMKRKRKILKKCLNAAINYPTQAGAASVVNRSGIALARAYKEASIPAKLIANIHDEWLVSCKKGYEKAAAELMQYHLENTVKLRLALKAEPVIGYRYGQIK